MIALSALPKNAKGIVKGLNTDVYNLTLGDRVKVRHIGSIQILVEVFSQDRREKIQIAVEDALKILVVPI